MMTLEAIVNVKINGVLVPKVIIDLRDLRNFTTILQCKHDVKKSLQLIKRMVAMIF
jgi:hypothetical protein